MRSDMPIGKYRTVTGHAYTMLYSVESSALFSMRNPWGVACVGADVQGDGVVNVPNDHVIPSAIDLRIMEPGKAAEYGLAPLRPYIPPMLGK